MSTTPRTDAAWSFAFTASEFSAASAARQMRDKCAELETELAAAKQEAAHYMSVAQKATDELAASKAECERLKFDIVEWEAKERGWNKAVETDAAELARLRDDNLTAHQMACAAGLERDRLRAELKELSQAYELNRVSIDELDADRARAEKAEAECLEQARLLGKSGEREADLLGKIDRLNRVIERASVQFFHDGTDGETAAKMLNVLNEAK